MSSETSDLYRKMLLIRTLETELQKLCDVGEAGDLHFSTGQEAISVGACAALRDTDYIVTHHRTIAHAVAKGIPLYPLVAEILGKKDGICGGMSGEMHLSHAESRFMFSFQLVGTCVPVAAGLAWAVKNHLKTDDIVAVFHGDAATANGQWHEGMNLAAVQNVPLLVICENNHLAGNVTPEHYQPIEKLRQRAVGYGIESVEVDGNDVEDVQSAAQSMAASIRRNPRPMFLECDTTRLGKHKQGQGDMRTVHQIAELMLRDPLSGVSDEQILGQVRRVIAEVRSSVDAKVSAQVR